MNSLGQKKRSCQIHLQQSSLRQGTSVLHSKITSTYTQNKKKHKLSGGKREVSLEFTPRGQTRRVHVLRSRLQIQEKTTLFSAIPFFFIFFLFGLGARSGITKSLKQNYLPEWNVLNYAFIAHEISFKQWPLLLCWVLLKLYAPDV